MVGNSPTRELLDKDSGYWNDAVAIVMEGRESDTRGKFGLRSGKLWKLPHTQLRRLGLISEEKPVVTCCVTQPGTGTCLGKLTVHRRHGWLPRKLNRGRLGESFFLTTPFHRTCDPEEVPEGAILHLETIKR